MKRLYLKQKVFSVRDRYKIFDETQQQLYHCEARLFSWNQKIDIIDSKTNQPLFTLKKKRFTLMPAYLLYDERGQEIAAMRMKYSMTKKKFNIQGMHGEFIIEGNLWAHQFSISKNQQEVVAVEKRLLSWGDTYEITIHDEDKESFYVALVVMIDAQLHNKKSRR